METQLGGKNTLPITRLYKCAQTFIIGHMAQNEPITFKLMFKCNLCSRDHTKRQVMFCPGFLCKFKYKTNHITFLCLI